MSDQKMIDSIKNYSKQIKTMSSYQEAVRHTVGQFLGYSGNRGFINMIREIFQNSADELMKDSSPCNEIWVAYDEKTKEVMIKDNGRGIPFDDIIRVFGKEHTSSNYVKTPGEFSSGRHGVGGKAVNACSEFFIVDSYILGKGRRVEFKYGNPDTAIVTDIPNNGLQGTIITFKAIDRMPKDMENGRVVMGNITTTCEDVLDLISALIPLLKVGAKVNFIGRKLDGEEIKEVLINRQGILEGLATRVSKPIIDPIIFSKMDESGTMKAEIAFTYDLDDDNDDIISYGNFCPTTDGTHVQGFLEGLTKFFRDYMNKIYLKNSTKVKVTNNDIKTGLKAVVSVAHLEPEFTGQAKENISNLDLVPFVKDLTLSALNTWSSSNVNSLQKVAKYFKEIAEVRIKTEEGITKIRIDNASSITGLPKKFIKPTGKKNMELFIMEGDSAVGPAKNNRDNERQGLFPIRGKVMNVMSQGIKAQQVIKNEEFASIISIIGAGYGKSFDINKCNWEKVIICTDADPDGAHIRTLLVKFFLMYMKDLITNGRLYAAVPPLYGGKVGNKFRYFTDRSDYNTYLQKSFFSKNHAALTDVDGRKYKQDEIVTLLTDNAFYIRDLERISNAFAIEPFLLEICVSLMNSDFKTIKNKITKAYRFLEVKSMKDGSILIEGLVNNLYHTILINDSFRRNCACIEEHLSRYPLFYMVDGVPHTLYGLMKLFESYKPKSIQRYKGLGEMNGPQLAESTISPDGERVLIQYTLEDAKYEVEQLKRLGNNNIELLQGVDISTYEF